MSDTLLSQQAQQTQPMSTEEYLQLPETTQPTQFIYGEKIVTPAPHPGHQILVGDLYVYCREQVRNGRWILSPADVRLDNHVVQPDIFWIRPDGDCVIEGNYWVGAPDFVVEVLSPSTAQMDRGAKFDIYQAAGVREYWLVESQGQFIEAYTRRDDAFQRLGVFGAEDTLTSPLFEADFDLSRVFMSSDTADAADAQEPDDTESADDESDEA